MVFLPKVFNKDLIRYVLSWVHDQFPWLDEEKPMKITKDLIHMVIRLLAEGMNALCE